MSSVFSIPFIVRFRPEKIKISETFRNTSSTTPWYSGQSQLRSKTHENWVNRSSKISRISLGHYIHPLYPPLLRKHPPHPQIVVCWKTLLHKLGLITFSDLKENFASTNESLQCFLPYCYYELPVVNAYMLTKKNEVIYSKSWYQLSYSWILMNLKSLLIILPNRFGQVCHRRRIVGCLSKCISRLFVFFRKRPINTREIFVVFSKTCMKITLLRIILFNPFSASAPFPYSLKISEVFCF